MSATDLAISCRCGAFKATLKNVSPRSGSHVQCHCKDCQAGAHALQATDTLLPRGGTDIYQTIPSNLDLTAGTQNLACLRLSPKGLVRWYASCCDTPLFNSLGSQKLAFLGVLVPALQGEKTQKAVGRVIAVAHTASASAGASPLKEYGFNRAGFNIVARHVSALMQGKGKASPLFDETGNLVVEPRVLSKQERKAATP